MSRSRALLAAALFGFFLLCHAAWWGGAGAFSLLGTLIAHWTATISHDIKAFFAHEVEPETNGYYYFSLTLFFFSSFQKIPRRGRNGADTHKRLGLSKNPKKIKNGQSQLLVICSFSQRLPCEYIVFVE
jgi:hypothetical protein